MKWLFSTEKYTSLGSFQSGKKNWVIEFFRLIEFSRVLEKIWNFNSIFSAIRAQRGSENAPNKTVLLKKDL